MSKTVNIAPKPTRNPSQEWVESRALPPERRPTRRLTLEIDAELHRRMRIACVEQDLVMADVIRELIEARFPAKSNAKPGE